MQPLVLKSSTAASHPLWYEAVVIALSHHEKFDGTEYLWQLKGEDIPLVRRIVAVADVFDALTSERPYKKAWEVDRALGSPSEENSGSHFSNLPACACFWPIWMRPCRSKRVSKMTQRATQEPKHEGRPNHFVSLAKFARHCSVDGGVASNGFGFWRCCLVVRPDLFAKLASRFTGCDLGGMQHGGEIAQDGVYNGALVITALHFDQPTFKLATTDLVDMADSFASGQRLAKGLMQDGLRNVLVLGQGVAINGSALIEGMRNILPPDVSLSGGLAGDGGAFQQTWTLSDQGVSPKQLVAMGFVGDHIQMRHGSFHGWQPFGYCCVTRCDHNVLYELDGEPALDIYKRYLGDYAKDLPGSGLLFPFEMLGQDLTAVGLIRTILGIDESNGSLILAGDIEPDGYLRLMHANTD